MDATQILTQAFAPLICTYWRLILLIILLTFLKTPFMKGILKLSLRKSRARLMKTSAPNAAGPWH